MYYTPPGSPRDGADCGVLVQGDDLRTRMVYSGAQVVEETAKLESTTGVQQKADDPVRVSISFAAADYAAIRNIAREKRVSAAWVVRDAVTSYLDARAPLFAPDRRENE